MIDLLVIQLQLIYTLTFFMLITVILTVAIWSMTNSHQKRTTERFQISLKNLKTDSDISAWGIFIVLVPGYLLYNLVRFQVDVFKYGALNASIYEVIRKQQLNQERKKHDILFFEKFCKDTSKNRYTKDISEIKET